MDIRKSWEESGLTSPRINYAVNSQNGETFLVVEDDSTIFRLVNSNGIIYVIAGFRCQESSNENFLEGFPYYTINDPVLHIVLCSKVESDRDLLAIELAKEYLE